MANRNKKLQKKYEMGGRGPKNPNTNTNKNKKFRRYGDDYPPTNDVAPAKGRVPNRMNDIKWYRSNDQLLNDVSRLAYNIPVGHPYFRNGVLLPQGDRMSVPGIALMNVVPTFGLGDNPSDPLNVAFAGMFTYIRSHTSSKFDWDDNTLCINMLATDSLYYFVKWCIRAFATLPLFHQANKYLPQSLLEMQGIDYADLLANAAKFRSELNLRIARINALKIPSELYVFARHMWMFENYYIEGDIVKDQIYLYKPAAYYVYGLDGNGLPMLSCHRTETGGTGLNGLLTANDLIRKIDAMLGPIFNDQYFNLISGYIEQAYEGKCMSLDYIPDQIQVPLIHSPEVLLQFKNAKPTPLRHGSGAAYYGNFFDVYQSPASSTDPRVCVKTKAPDEALRVYRRMEDGVAVDIDGTETTAQKYDFFMVANEYSKSILLTSPNGDVSAEENMINTRLVPVINPVPHASGIPDVGKISKRFGTEWPISVEIGERWYDSYNDDYVLFQYELHQVMVYDASAVNAFIVPTRMLPLWSAFKYLPELRICVRTSSSDPDVSPCEVPFFEIDNYTLVEHNTIEMMHNSAIMSMLRVPEIASTNLAGR